MKKLIILSCSLLLPVSAFPQDLFVLDGDESTTESTPEVDVARNIVPLPDRALIKFEKGQAPFYVELSSYARMLNTAIRRGSDQVLSAEAEVLGIASEDMEQILILLSQQTKKEQEAHRARLLDACDPVMRGEALSSNSAKEAIRALDDDISIRNNLAEETLQFIGMEFGADVEKKLIEQIELRGRAVTFSKVDQVAQAEAMAGGDFVRIFTEQCRAL
jgi:hypothetical protein